MKNFFSINIIIGILSYNYPNKVTFISVDENLLIKSDLIQLIGKIGKIVNF